MDGSFFFKPYIAIDTNLVENEKIILLKNQDENIKGTKICIWTIHIHIEKKFYSKFVTNCSSKVYLSKNKKSIGEEFNELIWNTYLPEQYNTNDNNLLQSYFNELNEKMKTQLDIARGIDKELLFLVALPNSENIYLITHQKAALLDDYGNNIDTEGYIKLIPLKFEDYDINIIFSSNEYSESQGRNYKLKIKGWNNIEFKRTFF